MEILIRPSKLSGNICALPSADESHIKLICAAFSNGTVRNVIFNEDVCATIDALKQLGADFEIVSDTVIFRNFRPNQKPVFNCGDSLKILLYFMCIARTCASSDSVAIFNGSDKIPMGAVSDALKILSAHGVVSDFNGKFPFTLKGKLGSGEFTLPSGCTREMVVALLLALNRNDTDSIIALPDMEKSCADAELAVDVLKESEIVTAFADNVYIVRGGQEYKLLDTYVGGDFGVAANFIVANFINSNIRVSGLDAMSVQSERVIFEILGKVQTSGRKAFELDCSELRKLVPILAVYACTLKGKTRLNNVVGGKYDDFVPPQFVCDMINSLGGKAIMLDGGLEIEGVKSLHGGTVDAHGKPHLVYAAAILATFCNAPVLLKNVECVAKTYSAFFDDYRRIGGIASFS